MKIKSKRISSKGQGYQLSLPGGIFTKHIQFGTPVLDGIYVVFFKHYPPLAHDNFPPAGMKICHYSIGAWACSEMVLAFLGPLPILSLDELAVEQECVNRQFIIGTLKGAAKNKFLSVYHPQYIIATLDVPLQRKGHFIFEMNSHKSMPTPVAKWGEEEGKWRKITEPIKYLKIIKAFQKIGKSE